MRGQALGGPLYLHDGVPDPNTNYDRARVGCFDDQHTALGLLTSRKEIVAFGHLESENFRHFCETTPQRVGPTPATGTQVQNQTTNTIFTTEGVPGSGIPGRYLKPAERLWIPARTSAVVRQLRWSPMQPVYWGTITICSPIQLTSFGTKEQHRCSRNHHHREPTVSESDIQVKRSGSRPRVGAAE